MHVSRFPTYVLYVLACLGLAGSLSVWAQGKLGRVREAVDPTTPSHDHSDDDDDDHHHHCDDGDPIDLGGEFSGYIFLQFITAPFVIPLDATGDDYSRGYFLPYPYADDRADIAMWIDRSCWDDVHINLLPLRDDPPLVKEMSARVSIEESNDFDDLNRVQTHLLLESASRWGLQTSWGYLAERLDCGCYDDLVLGDVNLVFRFAQNEAAQFRTGIGFRMLADGSESEWGFNWTYGGDWYPVRPFIASWQIDAGTLGSTSVFHARATIGAIISRWEVFFGYDYLLIKPVSLQGPVLGLRAWF